MLSPFKLALARSLPPKELYWLRSVKRAIMGEPPLSAPDSTISRSGAAPLRQNALPPPLYPSHQVEENRTLQDAALEKYIGRKIKSPYLYFDAEEILLLPAREIARTLTLSVQYLNSAHVNGDIAEFGTMGGFSALTIAAAMVYDLQRQPISDENAGENPFRKLRLFDSFEGLPEITSPVDLASPHVVSGAWSKGGCKVLGPRELRALVERAIPPHRIEIYEGWFADTVSKLPGDTRFAMIHFDGDLYQSTMDALTPCFARGFVSRGAVLCFDDWNCNRSIPSYGERRAWAELVERFQIAASHCGDYSVGGTKFIIHSYQGMSSED
jgi:O-methyltransferase